MSRAHREASLHEGRNPLRIGAGGMPMFARILAPLDRLIMGSTAERVVRLAPCPVVSMRGAA